MVMPVTFSVFEKIRGRTSTPTLSDWAVRKGDGLNFGSSPTDRSLAVSEPDRSERLRSPTETLRPRAFDAVCSMVGRNLLTGMRKGTATSNTTITTTAIRRIRSFLPIGNLRGESTRQVERAARAILPQGKITSG